MYCTHELSGPEVTINGCDCKNCSPDTEPLCEFLRMVDRSLLVQVPHCYVPYRATSGHCVDAVWVGVRGYLFKCCVQQGVYKGNVVGSVSRRVLVLVVYANYISLVAPSKNDSIEHREVCTTSRTFRSQLEETQLKKGDVVLCSGQ